MERRAGPGTMQGPPGSCDGRWHVRLRRLGPHAYHGRRGGRELGCAPGAEIELPEEIGAGLLRDFPAGWVVVEAARGPAGERVLSPFDPARAAGERQPPAPNSAAAPNEPSRAHSDRPLPEKPPVVHKGGLGEAPLGRRPRLRPRVRR